LHRSCSKACRNTQFLKCINWPHIFCGSKSGCHYSDTKFRPHTAFRSSHFVGHNHSTPPSPHANPSPLHKRVWPSNAPCDTTHANQHPHCRGHVPHTHLATTQPRVESPACFDCCAWHPSRCSRTARRRSSPLAPTRPSTRSQRQCLAQKLSPLVSRPTPFWPCLTQPLASARDLARVAPHLHHPGFGPRRTHAFWVMAQRAILNTHACGCWREM
jgi:hypothetical protein